MQKITELISVLDQRKDESIERTFKGVARHFREAFSELVPGGHGFLVMMKKKVFLFISLSVVFFFLLVMRFDQKFGSMIACMHNSVLYNLVSTHVYVLL